MNIPKPGRWILDSEQAGLSSLRYDASFPAPTIADLGPEDDSRDSCGVTKLSRSSHHPGKLKPLWLNPLLSFAVRDHFTHI